MRRIVAGRHVLGHTSYGAPIVHYTTPEAVEADFGLSTLPSVYEAYRRAFMFGTLP